MPLRTVLIALVLIPATCAGVTWLTLNVNDDWPWWTFMAVAGFAGAAASGLLGARRSVPLWGIGSAALTYGFFIVAFVIVIYVGDPDTGCPNDRIYC